jgi:hypothetical protein
MRIPIERLNAAVPLGADARYFLRRVPCTKAYCRVCPLYGGHGPYWYATWREGTGKRRQFCGRRRPIAISDAAAEQAITRYIMRQRRRGKSEEIPPETR